MINKGFCEHEAPLSNVCDECELGPMPFKKPTLEQIAWVFEKINENTGGSFRKLIYDRMGFGPNAYSELYSAGGQAITNAMCVEKQMLESNSDLIDSQLEQIEVLRPVYEAAKDFQGAWSTIGPWQKVDMLRDALFKAVSIAARELEDSDE